MISPVPVKVARSGVFPLCAGLGAWLLLFDSPTTRIIGVFTFFIALAIVFVGSLWASWTGDVLLDDGAVEKVTYFGGVIRITAADLDRDRSMLSAHGLRLSPRTGEAIFLSAGRYAEADLLRAAEHLGLARPGRRHA